MVEMKPQDMRKVRKIVEEMTLFDDDLMSMVFDNNIEATQLLLRILLAREDLIVLSVHGQQELENPLVEGRNIRLDILASDAEEKLYDIEIQRSDRGADFRRARFHSSMLDVRMLKEKEPFRELNDSYVIFITENDIIGYGLPVYHITRHIDELAKTVGDGSHIIYVNGQYKGDDAYGRLMHDMKCVNYDEMYYEELSKGVRHFKQVEGGKENMCNAVKEYAKEYAKECVDEKEKSSAVNFYRMGLGIDLIAKALERDSTTIRKWIETAPAQA